VPGVVDDDPSHDRPRRVRTYDQRDAIEVVGALAAAVVLAAVARSLFDWSGIMSTFVWAYLLFVAAYFALVYDRSGQEAAGDRIVTLLVWSAGAMVLGALLWMLGMLVFRGLPRLRPSFLTQDLSKVGPEDPGGGALHAIIGTLEQVGIAVVVVVPIAVLTAVYLHELKGRLAPLIRFVVDAMSGLPSIVAGLLVFTVWVNGRGFSGIAGSAALAVLMLPTVTRTSEEILRTIPDSLREASLALGAPEWRVVLKVVVPTALSGLVTASILGVARAIGETAPMLLTAFGTDSVNPNPLKGPQDDLPLFIWKLINLPNATQKARAWTGALVLVLLVLVLFVAARVIANRARKRLGGAR
jgi:phosphate transport system permease protein